MSKYVLTMTFVVTANNIRHAETLGASIENIVSCQIDDKDLFMCLEDTCLDYVEELEEDDE